MHELNKLRLAAGIAIDPALEKTINVAVNESRSTPLRKSDLKSRDQKSLSNKVSGLAGAIKHIQNAIKALEKIPATDFGGDVPHAIAELEDVIEGDSNNTGLIHVLDAFDKDYKDKVKSDKNDANVKAEEEEAAEFNDTMNLGEAWWDIIVKHPHTNGFHIQADSREEAENKAKTRLDNMKGGSGKVLSVKMNTKNVDPNKNRLAKQLDALSDEDKSNLFKKADKKQISGGLLTPLEQHVLDTSSYKRTAKPSEPKTEPEAKEEPKVEAKDTNESVHYYVDNKYTNYEDDEDKPVNVTDGSANDEQVWDDRNKDADESPSQLQNKEDDMEEKISIPADIKNQLRAEIKQARDESVKLDSSNKDAADFYTRLANAFEDLLNHLDSGTVHDFKKAQIFAQSLMGPFLHKIPNDVWKFLTNGGKTRSLKSYMQEVK